jgi:hypothetical protein
MSVLVKSETVEEDIWNWSRVETRGRDRTRRIKAEGDEGTTGKTKKSVGSNECGAQTARADGDDALLSGSCKRSMVGVFRLRHW